METAPFTSDQVSGRCVIVVGCGRNASKRQDACPRRDPKSSRIATNPLGFSLFVDGGRADVPGTQAPQPILVLVVPVRRDVDPVVVDGLGRWGL